MSDHSVQILDPAAVQAKLLRMAYQIYESAYGKTEFVMIGIGERGGFLAELLLSHLQNISPIEIQYVQAELDKTEGDPLLGIELEVDSLDDLTGKDLVVVDDVLYAGTTLLNVVCILLQARPASIQTAVLIDRGHRTMPVAADIIGMQLATTIQQHVEVRIDADAGLAEAYLS